ncbi:hypothetical protein [Lacrimispora sp.]|uniref:hypothetical protein n=1 Tax=Lacrimispora sp. TaxID=2719234 RepID=UPI0028965B3E|nr:hypothetical protein [Lacrimispora sp.]
MINIYCSGGCYLDVDMSYDAMLHILQDDIINENYFIEFNFADGTKGAVRKKHVNGVCESYE